MRCAPLTRLALVLDAADPAVVEHAQAAERAQLDLVTLSPGNVSGVHDRVLGATSRIGVVSADQTAAQAAPERSGVLGSGPAALVAIEITGPEAPMDADLVFVRSATGPVRDELDPLRAGDRPVRIFADVVLALGPSGAERAVLKQADLPVVPVVTGSPMQAMATLTWLKAAGGLDGFRLHLVDVAIDLPLVVTGLVPVLRDHDAFRRGYETRSLRGHLELPAGPSAQPAAAAGPAAGSG